VNSTSGPPLRKMIAFWNLHESKPPYSLICLQIESIWFRGQRVLARAPSIGSLLTSYRIT
jgi:hypothetical protein